MRELDDPNEETFWIVDGVVSNSIPGDSPSSLRVTVWDWFGKYRPATIDRSRRMGACTELLTELNVVTSGQVPHQGPKSLIATRVSIFFIFEFKWGKSYNAAMRYLNILEYTCSSLVDCFED